MKVTGNDSGMRQLMRAWYKQPWILVALAVFFGACFSASGLLYGHGRSVLVFPEIWIGGGLPYFPFSAQVMPVYPDVQWLYPCFPPAGCTVWPQYRSYEQRRKQFQPKPVFGQGAPLVDEAMEAWRAGLQPVVEPFRTDERQIVPALRDHSLVRPQYQNSGTVLPRFSTDTK